MRFAEVMGLMGAKVEWAPYSITITGGLAGRAGVGHWAGGCRGGKRWVGESHATGRVGALIPAGSALQLERGLWGYGPLLLCLCRPP